MTHLTTDTIPGRFLIILGDAQEAVWEWPARNPGDIHADVNHFRDVAPFNAFTPWQADLWGPDHDPRMIPWRLPTHQASHEPMGTSTPMTFHYTPTTRDF